MMSNFNLREINETNTWCQSYRRSYLRETERSLLIQRGCENTNDHCCRVKQFMKFGNFKRENRGGLVFFEEKNYDDSKSILAEIQKTAVLEISMEILIER